MHQPYTSSELFHFVGHAQPQDDARNCTTLIQILRAGLLSFPPHDKPGRLPRTVTVRPEASLLDEQLISPHITCFADIPAESLGSHVSRYGRFGLSFQRAELIKWGARPVAYVPTFKGDWDGLAGRPLLRDIQAVYKGFRKHFDDRVPPQPKTMPRTMEEIIASKHLYREMGKIPSDEVQLMRGLKSILEMELLAYIKPFNADLPDDHPDNFYMEREWRLLGQWPFDIADIVHVHLAPAFRSAVEAEFPTLADRIVEIPAS